MLVYCLYENARIQGRAGALEILKGLVIAILQAPTEKRKKQATSLLL